ncbi:MAG: hypothetical protein NTW90_06295 [Nitrosospira sp.]|nr:hypothetical protein [Nitrosospira sp.]
MGGSENKTSLADKLQSNGEVSLYDLMKFIRDYRAILLGGALVGGALGLAVAFALPAQWEASALIRIGHLGKSHLVEPPPMVVDRITQRSLKDDALKRMGVSPDELDPKINLLLNSLKVKIKESGLIDVHVRGTTPDDAIRFVDALIAELADIHTKMAEPTLLHWHSKIEEIDMESEPLNKEIERLNGFLAKATGEFSAANFSQVALMNSVLLTHKGEMHRFLERKRVLQEQISPEHTFPTSSLGRAEVSTQPVFPKKPLFAASGLVIGLLIGILLALWRSHVSVNTND